MLGLGRSFALEREQDALVGILLTPVSRGAIFLGKFLANLVLLLATATADRAHGHPPFFCTQMRDLDELLTALLGELREGGRWGV